MSQPHFGQVWGWSPTLGKVGGLEPSGTLECSELDSKAQNTLHWGVHVVIEKVLKRRYRKWPRIGHSDICSPSYGQKKGRESNWLSQPHFGQVWGVKPNTCKVGDLESSGTLECSELDSKAQTTSPWGVLGVIGKVLKRRYRKWPRIGHWDICSPSYGQKKGRESNWQFDSQPLKVGNRPLPDIALKSATWRWKALDESYNFDSGLVPIRVRDEELWPFKVLEVQPGHFWDSISGVPTKCAIWM